MRASNQPLGPGFETEGDPVNPGLPPSDTDMSGITVSNTIAEWEQAAAKRMTGAPGASDDKAWQALNRTRHLLKFMRRDLVAGSAEYTFVLTRPEMFAWPPKETIMAIAVGGFQDTWDDSKNENVRVLEILELVVTPLGDAGANVAGSELLRLIAEEVALSDSIVTLAPADRESWQYYFGLGFKFLDNYGPSMVFPEYGYDKPSGWKYRRIA